jgi:hypothetical protein
MNLGIGEVSWQIENNENRTCSCCDNSTAEFLENLISSLEISLNARMYICVSRAQER